MSNLDKIKDLLDAKLEALIQTKQQEFVQNSLTAESVPDNEINNKDERRKVSTALQKKAGDATVGGVKSKHGTASINVKSANESEYDEEDLEYYSIEEIQEFIETDEYKPSEKEQLQHDFVQGHLADKDINSKLVGKKTLVVDKNNVTNTKKHLKSIGHHNDYTVLGEEMNEREESPTKGTRKIASYGNHEHTAEVRYNSEYQEYQVHHYKNGKHMGEGPVSYHYEDKEDAHTTAKHSVGIKESELSEVSKELLGRYVKKSREDITFRDKIRKDAKSTATITFNQDKKKKLSNIENHQSTTINKRDDGIDRAHRLLKKEDISEGVAERKQDRVEAHEEKLRNSGYVRSKDENGSEYQFKWKKDGHPTHIVNYRFGNKGHAEHWVEGKIHTESLTKHLESEELSEVSKELLGRYIKKARYDNNSYLAKDTKTKDEVDVFYKRAIGISKAVNKLTKDRKDVEFT